MRPPIEMKDRKHILFIMQKYISYNKNNKNRKMNCQMSPPCLIRVADLARVDPEPDQDLT